MYHTRIANSANWQRFARRYWDVLPDDLDVALLQCDVVLLGEPLIGVTVKCACQRIPDAPACTHNARLTSEGDLLCDVAVWPNDPKWPHLPGIVASAGYHDARYGLGQARRALPEALRVTAQRVVVYRVLEQEGGGKSETPPSTLEEARKAAQDTNSQVREVVSREENMRENDVAEPARVAARSWAGEL